MKSISQQILSYVSGTIVEKRPSAVSGELEVWYQNGTHVLHSPDANYSFDTLHKIFQKTFKKFEVKKRNPKTVLILGFGAGSVASILCDELKLSPEITGVEFDPVVIDLAKKYFQLNRHEKLSIHIADAAAFIQQSKSTYDLVVSDVFIDKQVPESVVQKAYAEDLVRLTARDGMGMMNWICETKTQHRLRTSMEAWLRSLATKTEVYRASSVNYLLIWYR
ncbi:MAG: fused MFS/spermidine synthase [Flammeovirgaceae bacterium]|nr:MAG: fused MFS/spermidine synthase [Flammeovirgaceae bacterium]